ncbi:Aldo/keto reductase, partial [Rhizophagus irregularis]
YFNDVRLLDTACSYNLGESERFLGDYVSDKRSDVVISTKFTLNNTTVQKERRFNPNFGGNHRKSLVENLDGSLKRLNMSYVDILYVHVYEYRTPIEEFMRSLDDVVRSGKVGILPWSIVADGFLTGKYTRESNINLKSDYRNRSIINYSKDEKNWQILDEVIAISKEINRSPVQVALNWIQQKPGITSPLIGARTVVQLEENLKSLEFK